MSVRGYTCVRMCECACMRTRFSCAFECAWIHMRAHVRLSMYESETEESVCACMHLDIYIHLCTSKSTSTCVL